MERNAACASGFAGLPRSPVATTRIAAPPVPRRFVPAGVDPRAGRASRLLVADVAPRIATIRQGMALADHPAVQVGAVRVARPDHPSELIPLAYTATDSASRDHPAERPGRGPAHGPGCAVRPPAVLPALGSIDSMQTDLVARDFDGIAVDHLRDASKHVRRTSRRPAPMKYRFPARLADLAPMKYRFPVRLADLVDGRSRRIEIDPCALRYPEMTMVWLAVWLAAGMAAVGADFAAMAFHLHGHNEGDGSHHAKRDLQSFHRLPLRPADRRILTTSHKLVQRRAERGSHAP